MKLSNCNESCSEPDTIEEYFIAAEIANMLQFIEVLKIVTDKIRLSLDVNNVFSVMKFAESMNMIDLVSQARCYALTEFNSVKKSEHFLKLSLIELYKYLADIHLWCNNEMEVFNSIIDWFNHHDDDAINNESSLFLLLTCLDFNSLSIENLTEIKQNCMIQKYSEIVTSLNCIIDDKYTSCDKAKQLKNSKSRNRDCFIGLLNCNLNNFSLTWYVE